MKILQIIVLITFISISNIMANESTIKKPHHIFDLTLDFSSEGVKNYESGRLQDFKIKGNYRRLFNPYLGLGFAYGFSHKDLIGGITNATRFIGPIISLFTRKKYQKLNPLWSMKILFISTQENYKGEELIFSHGYLISISKNLGIITEAFLSFGRLKKYDKLVSEYNKFGLQVGLAACF